MKKFDIIKNRKYVYYFSLALTLIGIISFFVQGFNYDIDFIGGTTTHMKTGQQLDRPKLDKIADVAKTAVGEKPSSVQKAGDGTEVIIKTKELDPTKRDALIKAVKKEFPLKDAKEEALISANNISSTVGKDIRDRAILAVGLAIVLMLVYITFRFEFKSGLSAVITLTHDVFIMITVYTLFQIPLNQSFIAALLTILGYSINATIIVFDRIRENARLSHKESFEANVEKSIWQTMGRSINTNVTTLLTITMVLILGVTSIKQFAFPIIIGILAGMYSSIFLSGSLWVTLRKMGVGSKKR